MAAIAALTLALASTPSPAPSDATPVPAASPASVLKEIGRVRVTTPLCRTLLSNATDAIETETANDAKIGSLTVALATTDFDSSQLAKARAISDLSRRYVELRAAAVAGNGSMVQFRAAARDATSDEQRKALGTFADALDGALHRQKMLADDISRFITYLDVHEPINEDRLHDLQLDTAIAQNAGLRSPTGDPRDLIPPTLSTVAKTGASQIAERARRVADDEAATANAIDPAFAGC